LSALHKIAFQERNRVISGIIDCEITFARKHKVVKMFPWSILIRSYGLMKTYRKELWIGFEYEDDKFLRVAL
jgi:hypothetical protein